MFNPTSYTIFLQGSRLEGRPGEWGDNKKKGDTMKRNKIQKGKVKFSVPGHY